MPVATVTLEETSKTIFSSVYYKIIEDIARDINLPQDSLVILYRDNEVTLTDSKTNASVLETPNTPTTVSKRRIQVNISEQYNEDHLDTTAVTQQEYYPIYEDRSVLVSVAPIYVQTDVEIEFSYITPSKAEAIRLRDDIRLRLSQTRSIGNHDVNYNIVVPRVVEDFITDVYDIKNRLVPTELIDYLNEHTTKRLRQMTDLSNKDNVRLVVQERQVRIVGFYGFNSMPEKLDSDPNNNTHKLSFTYTFSFSAPKAMSIRYPVLMCNTLLPNKYIEQLELDKIHSLQEKDRDLTYIGKSMHNLSHFEAHRQLENRVDITLPVNLPVFDEFRLKQGHKGYGILMSMLPIVDETDKRTLISLTDDLDPYEISTILLDWIKTTERYYITTPYSSFLYLGLHQEGRYYDSPNLIVTEDLIVKSKSELNLLRASRVTLSICLDLSTLNDQAIRRIEDNTEILLIFVSEYMSAINTFKPEANRQQSEDLLFLHFLAKNLERLLDRDLLDELNRLLGVISEDTYMSSSLGRILKLGYPVLWLYLTTNSNYTVLSDYRIVEVTDHMRERLKDPYSLATQERNKTINTDTPEYITKANRHIIQRYAPKTVMSNNVTALRMTKLV